MKVLSVSNAKASLGRVIDRVIKTSEPVVIPRGENHVIILPYHLPEPDEVELARVFSRIDRGRPAIAEDSRALKAVQAEIMKYRKEKRRQK